MTSDKKETEEESWFSTGSRFGITKERNMEIQDDIRNMIEEKADISEIEKHISETYIEAGETYIAGFALCYGMITNKMKEENAIRKMFWNFLLGIKEGVINPFASPFPIELIEIIALNRDVTKGIRRSVEEYQKFLEKKKPEPEVA